jgi:hypothetical protein
VYSGNFMTNKRLYVRVGGKIGGPFEWEQIRRGVQSKKLLPEHEASGDGNTWFRLETIWQELVGDAEATTPPTQTVTGAPIEAARQPAPASQPLTPPPRSTAAGPLAVGPGAGAKPVVSPPPLPRQSPSGAPAGESTPAAGGADRALPNGPIIVPSAAAEPPNPWAFIPDRASASSQVEGPPRFAPAYQPSLVKMLRLLLTATGVAYGIAALAAVYMLGTISLTGTMGYSTLKLTSTVFGVVALLALLFELGASIFFLMWLENVFARLRVRQRKLSSDTFGAWAVIYFIPVVGSFIFAGFMTRVWRAASANRSVDVRSVTPRSVSRARFLRGVLWGSCIVLAALLAWASSLEYQIAAAQQPRSGIPSAPGVLEYLVFELRISGLLRLVTMTVITAAAAAVMVFTWGYVKEVHENMTADADYENTNSDDTDSLGAPSNDVGKAL